ncbi:hypothetical protein GCM10010916_10840 [Paenibacillus abyssi]|uniref:DUF4279 domain-containing protein n=2 Tax=Paenibacillus abyssi TaxID=1340531 RepID=A0A917FPY4_9BACL|nr:hypothetical protein GCM10010916_10840 [Paenibacillus abyssi]
MDKTSVMAYFSIFGDDFPLDKVTQILNIEPTRSYKKGEVIVRPKNDNVIITTTIYRKETDWELSTGYQESTDINDQLYLLLDTLENKVSELIRIKDEYKVSFTFMIVINIENNETPAMCLEQRFISFVHTINAGVDFDLYIFS